MKQLRLNWLKRINGLIAICLTLIGITGCDDIIRGGSVAMYGTPVATLNIKGKVTNSSQEGLDSIEISVRRDKYSIEGYSLTDSLGNYSEQMYIFPMDSVWIIAKDIKKSRAIPYASDSVKVELKFTDGDGSWDRGTSSITQNFELKPQNDTEE